MAKSQKQRLMACDDATLAEALLVLSARSAETAAMVERLIATPDEQQAGVKKKLASLKRSKRFIDWREVGEFADSLQLLLDGFKALLVEKHGRKTSFWSKYE